MSRSSSQTDTLTAQIISTLATTSPLVPTPSAAFVRALVSARANPPPLPSLVATARARLLAADITSSGPFDAAWAARSCFDEGTLTQTTKEVKLRRDVTVQVLDVEDLTSSTWETVQVLEAIERGETRRGREIIRLPPAGSSSNTIGDDSATPATAAEPTTTAAAAEPSRKNATHRLTVQDARGTRAYVIELARCAEKVGIGTTHIGEKIVLRAGTAVARGMVLMVPDKTVFLGGKVDVWDKAWTAGRLEKLRGELERTKQEGTID